MALTKLFKVAVVSAAIVNSENACLMHAQPQSTSSVDYMMTFHAGYWGYVFNLKLELLSLRPPLSVMGLIGPVYLLQFDITATMSWKHWN